MLNCFHQKINKTYNLHVFIGCIGLLISVWHFLLRLWEFWMQRECPGLCRTMSELYTLLASGDIAVSSGCFLTKAPTSTVVLECVVLLSLSQYFFAYLAILHCEP